MSTKKRAEKSFVTDGLSKHRIVEQRRAGRIADAELFTQILSTLTAVTSHK